METLTDEQLIREVASGRERALEVLLCRHETPVRTWLARRLGRREDAEEATQDVFLKVGRAARTFNGSASFRPWLRAIARNVLRDRLRRRACETTVSLPVDPSELLDVWRREIDPSEIRAALATLPERYRRALALKYLAGLTYREAAAELGLSERGFETRLARARVRLREALARAGGGIDAL